MSGARAAAAQKLANRIYEYSEVAGKTTGELITKIEDFARDNELTFDQYYVTEIKRIIGTGVLEVSNETSPVKIANFISTTLFSKAVLNVHKDEQGSLRIEFQNLLNAHHAKDIENNKKEQDETMKKIEKLQQKLQKQKLEGSALSGGSTVMADRSPEVQSNRAPAPPAKQFRQVAPPARQTRSRIVEEEEVDESMAETASPPPVAAKKKAAKRLPAMQPNALYADDEPDTASAPAAPVAPRRSSRLAALGNAAASLMGYKYD